MTTEHQPWSPGAVDEVPKDHFDTDGNPCTLDTLCRREPAWAANIIRTLRARVGELETEVETRNEQLNEVDYDLAMLAARAESAEARVKEREHRVEELECAEAELNLENERLRDRLNTILTITRRGKRITDLESQLAAAREEQGLEAKVREALGPRWFELLISRAVTGTWTAHWNKPEPAPTAHRAKAETLPALLRAILEVEAKGG